MNVDVKPSATAFKLKIDRDVDVPMRDGAKLKADVFRPDDGGKFPALLNLGPYQKDKLWTVPPNLEEKQNEYMNWETVNPEWWVPRGYASVRVDGRGSGKSPGQCEPWSYAEAVDFYDAIEWAAAQPWCNGKVGLSGISYFAINQWFVANLQPPSLKAIIPWEGFADIYRDALFHGGILSVFMTNWITAHTMHHVMGRAARDLPAGFEEAVRAFMDHFPSEIDEYEGLLKKNPLWMDRTRSIGVISAQEALTRIIEHREIFHDEMLDLMRRIMGGEMSQPMMAALLMGLRLNDTPAAELVKTIFSLHENIERFKTAETLYDLRKLKGIMDEEQQRKDFIKLHKSKSNESGS